MGMPIPGPLIFIPAVLETGGALLLIGLPQILPESAGSRVAKIENEEDDKAAGSNRVVTTQPNTDDAKKSQDLKRLMLDDAIDDITKEEPTDMAEEPGRA